MNECMLRHATPEEMDRAREQWFQDRTKKAKERKEQMAREEEERKQGKRLWNMRWESFDEVDC